MKTTKLLALALVFALLFALAACTPVDPWQSATYTEDTELGEGATAFVLDVVVGEHKVAFTINTDETNLGKALVGSGIVSGEDGPYGLYIKVVNGITADYDIDASYWSFTVGGEYSNKGVSDISVTAGARYELTYTK